MTSLKKQKGEKAENFVHQNLIYDLLQGILKKVKLTKIERLSFVKNEKVTHFFQLQKFIFHKPILFHLPPVIIILLHASEDIGRFKSDLFHEAK